MKIKARKPNGKQRVVYSRLTEKKAKDLLMDIKKNLETNTSQTLSIDTDGMRLSGMINGNPVEYLVQE